MNQDPLNRQRQMPRPEPRPASFDMRPMSRPSAQAVTRPVAQRPVAVQPQQAGVDGPSMGDVRPVAPVATTPSVASRTPQQVHIPYPEAPAGRVKAAPEVSRRKRPEKGALKRWGLIFGAVVVLGVTGYVGVDTWFTNNKVKAEIAGKVHDASQAQNSTTRNKELEGTDEKDVSAESLRNYKVAADLPRILSIDKINLKARVLPMSVNADDSIQAPININDSGWYTGSVKPGETGAMFIDGHASGATRMGLFAYLDTLKEGDMVSLEKGDGTVLKYKVVHVDIVPLDGIDMKKVLLPYNGVTKGLNLMTCTGTWVPDGKTYDHRVVVYTEQVS